MKNINIKKAVSWIGTALMLVSLVFIALQIWNMRGDIDFSTLSSPFVIAALLIVALAEGFVMILNSLNYRIILSSLTSIFVKPFQVVKVYTTANLYKYIPGGIMYVVGRNRLAVDIPELSHGKVALSTVVEGVLWAVAGIIISATYAFNHSLYYIRQLNVMPMLGIVVAALVLLIVVVAICFRHRLSKLFSEKFSITHFRFGVAIKLLFSMFMLKNLWAATFIAVLMVLGQPMTIGLAITLMGLYILSWTAGFLTPGAPSGLGIREFVLLMFMGGTINDDILLSAIVIHRALQVAGDIIAYVMVIGYGKIKGN